MLTDSELFENVHYLPIAAIIDLDYSLFLWLLPFFYVKLFTLKGAKLDVILKMRFGEEEDGMVLLIHITMPTVEPLSEGGRI